MRFLRERGGRDGRERDGQLDEERENWNRIKKTKLVREGIGRVLYMKGEK